MAARQGVLAAIVAFVTMVAPAEATIRKGAADDRAQDTSGGTNGHDILQAVGVSDDTGAAAVAIRLAGTPAQNAFVVGVVGTRLPDSSCGAPFVVFSGHVGTRDRKSVV